MIRLYCCKAAVLFVGLALIAVRSVAAGDGEITAKASQALVTVIHLAADGSDIMRGNGFLIGSDGLFVTNFHLVAGAARLQIKLANGDVYDQVNVRGADPAADLIILKIPAFNAPHVTLATGQGPGPGAGESVSLVCQPVGRDSQPVRGVTVKTRFSIPSKFDGWLFEPGLDAASKGCPMFDRDGTCLGITTLALRPATGEGGATVAVGRILGLLAKPINRPLDLVDWSSWPAAADAALIAEFQSAGIRPSPPSPEIRTEKNLRRRLELALEFDPSDLQSRALLARACIQDRAYEDAASQIEKILGARPRWLEALSLKGDLLCHTGSYDEARKTYADIVRQGYQPPHNYSKERAGVQLHNVIHDHALDHCSGPIVLTETTFDFVPVWPNDRFSVEYARIQRVEVKLGQKPGEIRYELSLYFDRPVPNEAQTWTKNDIALRVPDLETGQNLAKYLRGRGIDVREKN